MSDYTQHRLKYKREDTYSWCLKILSGDVVSKSLSVLTFTALPLSTLIKFPKIFNTNFIIVDSLNNTLKIVKNCALKMCLTAIYWTLNWLHENSMLNSVIYRANMDPPHCNFFMQTMSRATKKTNKNLKRRRIITIR